jgi:hypothetical protein
MTVVKYIGAKIGAKTSLCCIDRASVILASSSTASSASTTTISAATIVSSSSTAHREKFSNIYVNVTIDKKD